LITVLFSTLVLAGIIPNTPQGLVSSAEKILSKEFQKSSWRKNGFPHYIYPTDCFEDFKLGVPSPRYHLKMEVIEKMDDASSFADAIRFDVWEIPIYIGDEDEPRTMFRIRRNNSGNWWSPGNKIGGDPRHMCTARRKWPIEDGYRHAKMQFSNTDIFLIMVEKGGKLFFWDYQSNKATGEEILGLVRNEDGTWPVFSRDYLIGLVKRDEIPIRRGTISELYDHSYLPARITLEKQQSTYEAVDGAFLQVHPNLIHYDFPQYPVLSLRAQIEGDVVLKVTIGTDGRVESAKIIESDVSNTMEKMVLDAAKNFLYEPGRRDSKPVRCEATHLISFRINDDLKLCPLD